MGRGGQGRQGGGGQEEERALCGFQAEEGAQSSGFQKGEREAAEVVGVGVGGLAGRGGGGQGGRRGRRVTNNNKRVLQELIGRLCLPMSQKSAH
eukprot:865497-Prorocentrum_minimum.AAC.1